MKLEALRALYEAVKAGRKLSPFDFLHAFGPSASAKQCNYWGAASRGDMNAALALMPAVLPDALVSSMDQDSNRRWYVTLTDIRGKFLAHDGADTPARALLLAILDVLIAIEEGKG